MAARVLVAVLLEIAYAVLTRTWFRALADGIELELMTTTFRAATAVVYWLLFQHVILGRPRHTRVLKSPCMLLGAAVALSIPFLFRGWSPGGGLATALVFASTSIVVGIREELLYRGVLLNLLEPKIGSLGALLVSTALFVVYHYGALPVTVLTVTEIVCMSLFLGLIYMKSGSLVAVIALHSLYDAVWFFGPYVESPLTDLWRPVFLIAALAFVVLGVPGCNRSATSRPFRSSS